MAIIQKMYNIIKYKINVEKKFYNILYIDILEFKKMVICKIISN